MCGRHGNPARGCDVLPLLSVSWHGVSGLGLTGAVQAAGTSWPLLRRWVYGCASSLVWAAECNGRTVPAALSLGGFSPRARFPSPPPNRVHSPGQGPVVVRTRALEPVPQPLTPICTPDILCEPLRVLQLSWGSALQVYIGVKIPVFWRL